MRAYLTTASLELLYEDEVCSTPDWVLDRFLDAYDPSHAIWKTLPRGKRFYADITPRECQDLTLACLWAADNLRFSRLDGHHYDDPSWYKRSITQAKMMTRTADRLESLDNTI